MPSMIIRRTIIAIMSILFISTLVGGAFAGTITYVYDEQNRLTEADYPDGTIIKYHYDKLGNITQRERIGGPDILTVQIAGPGTVTSNPTGINCPSACTLQYTQYQSVLLTAVTSTNSGSTFAGWSGGGCESYGQNPCPVTMDSSKTVTATFETTPAVISTSPGRGATNVSILSNVTVNFNTAMDPTTFTDSAFYLSNSADMVPATIQCNTPCTTATLTPNSPLASSTNYSLAILGGSGGVKGASGTPVKTSYFTSFTTKTSSTLTVGKSGTGSGTVTSTPAGISCDASCTSASSAFDLSSTVTLTATTYDPSIAFAGWSGGGCSGTGVCLVTMNSPTTVTATFNYIASSDAPSGLTATVISPTQINLAWTKHSNNEIGFVVERSTAGTYVPIALVGTNVTSYADKGLIQSTNYSYRVRAYNTGWYSPYSNEANATTGVPSQTILSQISAGGNHTVALKANGILWAWGDNEFGQLGDGTTDDKTSPVQIGTDTWVSIAAGSEHTVALKSNGQLWAWGQNNDGQLGDGSLVTKSSPTQIGTDINWVSIAAGGAHTVALKSNGTLWAWGNNDFGQVGDKTSLSRTSPVQIGTDTNWVSISAGENHTVALKSDGTLWVWGYHGKTVHKEPFQIGTDKWVSIAAGGYHTLAKRSDGTLWAWGLNSDGQLGDGNWDTMTAPVQIGTNTQWDLISGGGFHSVALKSDGTLRTWGYNDDGEIGDNTTDSKTTPTQIGSDTQWSSISAGDFHTVALKSDGSLWVWGYNGDGQLGDGTTVDKLVPTQITYYRTLNEIKTGAGTGTVTNDPAALTYCPTGCFEIVSQVTITAQADAGSYFNGWSGEGCSGRGTCTVMMNADRTVTAAFEKLPKVTIRRAGTGQGTVTSSTAGTTQAIQCGGSGGTCSTSFKLGSQVTLTAAANTDDRFVSWSGGGCSGTGSCILTLNTLDMLNTETTVTATFNIQPPIPNFSCTPTSGSVPLTVSCTDQSTKRPASWFWDFGDGETSTQQNPSHIYAVKNTFPVTLSAINSSGSNTLTKNNYISTATCANKPVRINRSTPVYFDTPQAAYDAAVNGDTIQSQAVNLMANLNANQNIAVTLKGGYDCGYSSVIDSTGLLSMTTNSGVTTVSDVELVSAMPDITIVSLQTGTTMDGPGQIMSTTITIKNQGAADVGSFYVTLYLSTDATSTLNDISMGTCKSNGLAAGAQQILNCPVTIPVNFTLGTYFVKAMVDPGNLIQESNETNSAITGNQISVSLADLTLLPPLKGPTSATPGQKITVTATIQNLGTGGTNTFFVGLYLSPDTNISQNGALIQLTPISLAAGEKKTVPIAMTIPVNQPLGTYYLGAIANSYGQVPESNLDNNTIAGNQITIIPPPDLTIVPPLAGPTTGTMGEDVTVTTTIKNQGPGNANAFYVALYLSNDATITTSDVIIGSWQVSGLASGATQSIDIPGTIPLDLPPGIYYLGVIADVFNVRSETNENNNALTGNQIFIE